MGAGRQRLPQVGRKSAGVARQYCGRLGKVANCQAGMFLAYVSPLKRALVDKRLYLPESWASDKGRCAAAGVPEERRSYRSKTGLALEMLERALERGHLRAQWVAGDDAFGMSPSFRDGLAALGMHYVLDVPGGTTVWPLEPVWTSAEYQGFGRPRKPRLRDGQRRTMEQRSDELPGDAWREITVAEGSQGPRSPVQRPAGAANQQAEARRNPLGHRRNLDGSEPRYYLSNAPEDTPLETLAYVGGSRWRIETEFETEKSRGTGRVRDPHLGLASPCGPSSLSPESAAGYPGSPGPKSTGWCGKCWGTVRATAVAGGDARMQRTGQTLPCQAPSRPSYIPGRPSLNRLVILVTRTVIFQLHTDGTRTWGRTRLG